jgi:HSP20 family protein
MLSRRFPLAVARLTPRSFLFPAFGGLTSLSSLFDELDYGRAMGPRVSVRTNQDGALIEFDVPRFKNDELKVTTRDGVLTVRGKKKNGMPTQDQLVYGDAPASAFERSFCIPRSFDLSKMSTELDSGVFTVKLPRIPEPEETEAKTEESAASEKKAEDKSEDKLTTQATPSSVAAFDDVAKMVWPPRLKVQDNEKELCLTLNLPASIQKDNIDLKLHGNYLTIAVSHQKNVEKKDSHGNVVFSESQSVHYSTPVTVPQGTKSDDISTKLDNGVLTIKIAKRENSGPQQVKIQ